MKVYSLAEVAPPHEGPGKWTIAKVVIFDTAVDYELLISALDRGPDQIVDPNPKLAEWVKLLKEQK